MMDAGSGRRPPQDESRKGAAAAPGLTDVGTQLAHERTDLALDRSFLAIERTLMAWIRTALSMISFGFTIGKIGQALHSSEFKTILGHERSVESVAYFLVVLGTGAMLGAAVQYRMRLGALKRMGLKHGWSMAFIVSILLSMVGVVSFTALVMEL